MKSGIIGLPKSARPPSSESSPKSASPKAPSPIRAKPTSESRKSRRPPRQTRRPLPPQEAHPRLRRIRRRRRHRQDALKETAYIGHLRQVDALIHVLRAFESDDVPLVHPIDPLRDIKNVEFDLMVSDLGQIEKRLERLEKDLKKMKTPDLEKENELLIKAKAFLETEKPSAKWR